MTVDLELRGVTKSYRDVPALRDFGLTVNQGELMCLLGPSGCGKTSALRVIVGLERVEQGEVWLGGEEITHRPVYRRNIGVVFQNYALFPHLTANENVGFGLKMRGWRREEMEKAVTDALRQVDLSGCGDRYPRQLSGGQQQRVALARALAIRPRLLLLDEPLSNLDAKLREEMRVEIRQIQREVGITTIFVTHDQEEALAMSDQMAVMRDGRVLQIGRPFEIYERPEHPFVAGFIGQSNLLRGRVVSVNGRLIEVETLAGLRLLGEGEHLAPGALVVAVVKHERIRMAGSAPSAHPPCLLATIQLSTYLGGVIQYACGIGSQRLSVSVVNHARTPRYDVGDKIYLSWDPSDCLVLPDVVGQPGSGGTL